MHYSLVSKIFLQASAAPQAPVIPYPRAETMMITYHIISIRQGLHFCLVDFLQKLIQLDKTLAQVFWYINTLDAFRRQSFFKFLLLLDFFLPLFLSSNPVIPFSKVKIVAPDIPFLKN